MIIFFNIEGLLLQFVKYFRHGYIPIQQILINLGNILCYMKDERERKKRILKL